jgi:hypothetical protein
LCATTGTNASTFRVIRNGNVVARITAVTNAGMIIAGATRATATTTIAVIAKAIM